MARILYGVHATGYGHVNRVMTITRDLPEHEFLFVCQGPMAEVLSKDRTVVEVPGMVTVIRSNQVAYWATLTTNLRTQWHRKRTLRRIIDLIERFQPDVAITDYEFFVPWACQEVGLPCLSLDHAHILTAGDHSVSFKQYHRYMLDRILVGGLFSRATDYVVVSFFRPEIATRQWATLIPPVLRHDVLRFEPGEGDHILAFRGHAGFEQILPVLKAQPRPVILYGFDTDHTEGNLIFKKRSIDGFLEDLATSRYVICGGGHTLVSEALFYGKPVLSFAGHIFEQHLNSHYIELLGYGKQLKGNELDIGTIRSFEAGLAGFHDNVKKGRFCGNQDAVDLVNRFVERKSL